MQNIKNEWNNKKAYIVKTDSALAFITILVGPVGLEPTTNGL